jgi:hypothetical protein
VSALLALSFTRLTPERHRFEYRRADGTGEAIEMETMSFLTLDLLRYAVESEARLRGSFYGILARIGGYEELSVTGGAALGGEIAITEQMVGALSVALQQDDIADEDFVAALTHLLELHKEHVPRWLSPALVAAVRERMRQLTARWEATPFGQAMELEFPSPLAGEGVGKADG